MSSHPEYTYAPKGSSWVVYRWEYSGTVATGTPVYTSFDRERARRECFRLNGWKYKGPTPDKTDIEILQKSAQRG